MNNNIFSARIVELRKERGISQKDAAIELGVSQALLSHYEKGIRECSLDFVCKVSAFYDVSCDYLLGQVDVRRTLGEDFDGTDSAQDSEFRTSTLFRASAMLNDSLVANGSVTGDSIKEFFAMSIYKIAICAAQSGSIPKDWLAFDADVSSAFWLTFMEKLSNKELLSPAQKTEQQKPVFSEPICVKTVIEKAESIIENEAGKLLSIKSTKSRMV